ncbi:DUF4012 domain-containing protein [Georgenia sp. TF02-10]|uniref:DUF4012 domain-containing protein n=1 Tax=Georgenia sp. TF02-10 TaxID=2917725 RepID=UPI001FA7EAC0|nr:DUF4012 domain-containing protein [Georgenia sp. TF02-10]UNX55366.1 DUF4012 domain-containing protein [Georgenia sp. TF02-10]
MPSADASSDRAHGQRRGAGSGHGSRSGHGVGSGRGSESGRRRRSGSGSGRGSERRAGSRRRGIGPVAAVLGALAFVVLLVAVVLALDARTAYAALRDAQQDVTVLQEHVLAGDGEAAAAASADLQDDASTARDAMTGPHWDLAAAVPRLGANVRAVQVVSEVVDDVATGALPPLLDAVAVLHPARLVPVDGRIDPAPLAEAAPQVATADDALQAARADLAAVDPATLLPQLRAPLGQLTDQVADLGGMTGTASRAARLLPTMLGTDGPRDYLVLVQNNSEPRALGGLPGAVVLLRADDGRIEFVEQRSAASLNRFPTPVVELTDGERGLYGTQLGRYPGNVTATPDFPRAAQIIREMWRQRTGAEVDGVLSLDPVALQGLLAATGPVTLPTGAQLTGDNAAQVLLNQVYLDVADPAAQDAFYAAAAQAVFAQVLAGGAEPAGLLTALSDAVGEGRLLAWSADPAEQEVLAGTAVAGALRGHVGDAPVVGVYVHDTSGAKIAYYEHLDAEVTATACRPDGSQEIAVKVTLASAAPADAATLPPSLTGGGRVVTAGDTRSQLMVYAPTGSRITAASISDDDATYRPHQHDGLAVAAHTVTLAPGERVTAEYTLITPRELSGAPQVRTTPGPAPGQFSGSTSPCTR